MAKILITGASGLIGERLTEILLNAGHEVSHLGRSRKEGKIKSFQWNISKRSIDREALRDIDTIVHLAGAGIADKPWTDARKTEILESRTLSTRLLYQELKKGGHNVRNFVSASAIGYYGFEDRGELLDESAPAGSDFLAQVVRKWENEVDEINSLDIRVVKIRIGIVLSEKGGALAEIVKPVKYFAGAPLGSGKQSVSWIHIEDLCEMFRMAVENDKLSGAYNGVAPGPVTNRQLTESIARALQRPVIFPAVPGFVLKLLFGEMADLVLKGSRVSGEKIRATGFRFQYKTLDSAVQNLLNRG